MARSNGISAISYSTLLVAFLLFITNAEGRVNPNALAAASTLTCTLVYGAEVGDTCSSIPQNFGLSAESFLGINPNMNCNNIFVGQWLCINGELTSGTAIPTATTNSGLSCSQIYGFQFGDTCSGIIQNFGLSAEIFSELNPNLNCNKIFVGEWLCINGGSS
ncbi:hypothetical protein LIER_00609 [Lithospermum erythrorhizon]|uniref:LysM domain-containing protein n=1 Tax=Lithospermum erythrorhizon TaxID=34254 RepID=A0AAV3NJ40_LITER